MSQDITKKKKKPSDYRKCFVKGCKSYEATSPDVKFFRLPATVNSNRDRWLEFAQNPVVHLPSRTHFCGLHFGENAFTSTLRTRLVQYAVPTLFPPKSQSETPQLPSQPCTIQVSTPNIPDPSHVVPSTSTPFQINETSTISLSCPDLSHTYDNHHSSIRTTPRASDLSDLSRPPESSPRSDPQTSLGNESSFTVGDSAIISTPKRRKSIALSARVRKSIKLSDINCTRKVHLTPRKAKLYEYGRRVTKELEELRTKYKAQKFELKKLNSPDNKLVADVQYFSRRMSKASALFFAAQCKNYNRKSTGRRWTVQEKIQAITFYKRSPKCYTLLRTIFCLPSPRTLTTVLNSLPFLAGINEQIFATLRQSMEIKSELGRNGVLLFDEISLRENHSYNVKLDRIEGYVDDGTPGRSNKVATHCLLFMVRGLFQKWKQPVAYYFFDRGGVTALVLKFHLLKVIAACEQAGVRIRATVCDMGTSNQKAMKDLGVTSTNPYFMHNGHRIMTIFDPPHLLKCIRNQFLKHDVECTLTNEKGNLVSGAARWAHVVEAATKDKKMPFCMLHKITDQHLNPVGRTKMKVKHAAQVLSRTVAAQINVHHCNGAMDSDSMFTAYFVDFMDKLFDSCNGSEATFVEGKPHTHRVDSKSVHECFWKEAFNTFSSLKFVSNDNQTLLRPPSVDGWLITLRALMTLFQDLGKDRVEFFWTRNLNQDPLENIFGLVRYQLGSNHYPNTVQFAESLKTCIINGLACRTLLQGTNCAVDDADILSDLQTLLCGDGSSESHNPDQISMCDETSDVTVDDSLFHEDEDYALVHETNTFSAGYVAGFIAKKLLENINCESCNAALCLPPGEHNFYTLGIVFREYTDGEYRLIYPTKKLYKAVRHGAILMEKILDVKGHKDNIKRHITDAINKKQYFLWLQNSCSIHGETLVMEAIERLCKVSISWWCRRKNRFFRSLRHQ